MIGALRIRMGVGAVVSEEKMPLMFVKYMRILGDLDEGQIFITF